MSDGPMKLLASALVVGGIIAFAMPDFIERLQPASPPPVQQTVAAARPVQPVVAPKPASGFGTVALSSDGAGHFHARIEIDGAMIQMLVDTGASIVALRAEDAANLGINPMPDEYNVRVSTANGDIQTARVRLREVRLENITVYDVDAVVMPQGALAQSLLGMSFLRKLSSFEIAAGQLVLRP